VLLAGGKSRRMGRDKAFIDIAGVPLWQKQIDTLERTGPAKIFIAGPPHADWIATGCEIVNDARDDAGPLAGIVSAMQRTTTTLLLVLAVDLPQMTAACLQQLVGASSERAGIVPTRRDRSEPLAAIYPITALAIAERHLLVGEYSIQQFAGACLRKQLLVEQPIRPTELPLFLNANTPADLALAQ
jgi:molybdopterin-guanine dinucleotide biosynthesis protein A